MKNSKLTISKFFSTLTKNLIIGIIFCIFVVLAAIILCGSYAVLLTVIFVKVFLVICVEIFFGIKNFFFGDEKSEDHVEYEENDQGEI
jgi:hypothetical protein